MVQMVIVVLVLAVTLVFAGRAIVRTLKGKGDCGCGCDNCPYAGKSCDKQKESSVSGLGV